MDNRKQILSALERVECRARGSRFGRFLRSPFRYLVAMIFSKLLYRITQKSKRAKTWTFFGESMLIQLPAAIDLFLLGCKSHDSELRLSRFLIRQLKTGDTFVDVGAHYGFFSLLGSRLVGTKGRVYAFEPSGESFRILQQNVRSKINITPINKAVNDLHAGTTKFYEFPPRLSEFSSMFIDQLENSAWSRQAQAKMVETVSLDGYFPSLNHQPDFVKIDVEGAEPEVVKGMKDLLETRKPIIIMEYLSNPKIIERYNVAAAHLYEAGYQSFQIDRNGGLVLISDISAFLQHNQIVSENIVFTLDLLV